MLKIIEITTSFSPILGWENWVAIRLEEIQWKVECLILKIKLRVILKKYLQIDKFNFIN